MVVVVSTGPSAAKLCAACVTYLYALHAHEGPRDSDVLISDPPPAHGVDVDVGAVRLSSVPLPVYGYLFQFGFSLSCF